VRKALNIDRVVNVDRVTSDVQKRRGISRWSYSLDFNEKSKAFDYLLEFLSAVSETTSSGFERIQYIEQPTARDLKANPQNRMHEAAKIRPVVIDESLVDLESLLLARDMGYTGVRLQGMQRADQSFASRSRTEDGHVSVRAGFDVPRGHAHSFRGTGRTHSRCGRDRSKFTANICPPQTSRGSSAGPGIFRITAGTMQTGVLTGPRSQRAFD